MCLNQLSEVKSYRNLYEWKETLRRITTQKDRRSLKGIKEFNRSH